MDMIDKFNRESDKGTKIVRETVKIQNEYSTFLIIIIEGVRVTEIDTTTCTPIVSFIRDKDGTYLSIELEKYDDIIESWNLEW